MTVHIIENPPDDERSADENNAANAVAQVLKFPLKGVYIFDNSREAGEHRHMTVFIWTNWIGKRIFKQKKKACEAAVREVIGPVGKVTVDLVPQEVLDQAHAEAR